MTEHTWKTKIENYINYLFIIFKISMKRHYVLKFDDLDKQEDYWADMPDNILSQIKAILKLNNVLNY